MLVHKTLGTKKIALAALLQGVLHRMRTGLTSSFFLYTPGACTPILIIAFPKSKCQPRSQPRDSRRDLLKLDVNCWMFTSVSYICHWLLLTSTYFWGPFSPPPHDNWHRYFMGLDTLDFLLRLTSSLGCPRFVIYPLGSSGIASLKAMEGGGTAISMSPRDTQIVHDHAKS